MENKYIAIDVGGTGIKYALMNEQAEFLDQGELPTPKDSLHNFVEEIAAIYEKYKACKPRAIVMSAPGKIDAQKGFFYTGGALHYLHNCDLKSILEKRIPLDFTVQNDAKAAALAELWKGSMKDVDSGLVITLGTGIGGALIIDHKLWQGHTCAAGELSGIPTNWNTRINGIGNSFSDMNCTRVLTEKYAVARNMDPDAIDGKMFFKAVLENDSSALNELDWYCETLATALLGLQMILDVEKVAIGGGISRQQILIETLRKKVSEQYERMPWYCAASKPEIEACTYSNDANLVGALYCYLNQKENRNGEQ